LTVDLLLDAIGDIPETYILAARKTGGEVVLRSNRISIRRKFISILVAAILALSAVFATAMAASENFRNVVFSFFYISASETVPPVELEAESGNRIDPVFQLSIGDEVSAEYLRIKDRFDYGQGVIYLIGDAEDGEAFYTATDGALVKLDTHDISLSYEHSEIYDITFRWCASDSCLFVHGQNKEPGSDISWYVSTIYGRTDLVLLVLASGRQEDYIEYPVILDLETQEVKDILKDCTVAQEESITSFSFTPDLSKALISIEYGAKMYCYDVDSGNLIDVSTLAGDPAVGAWFIDSNTICSYTMESNNEYIFRVTSLSTGITSTVLQGTKLYTSTTQTGILCYEKRYGLFIDTDQTTYVFDFLTGEKSIIEGFTMPSGAFMTMNQAGTKLLYAVNNPVGGSFGISEVGLLDLNTRSFAVLTREGYDVRQEVSVGWFDNARIFIHATGADGMGYMYLYSFKN